MRLRLTPRHILLLKLFIHIIALSYLIYHYVAAFSDQLGADPVKAIIHFTGMGALNLLILTLAVSPMAMFFKQPQLMKVRRLLGLYSFTYALFHLSNYLLFDLQLDFATLLEDIIERPYITVGFTAILILTALAVTSPKKIQQQMGKSWSRLHKFVYAAAILTALHFIWSVKSLTIEPFAYATMLAILLSMRNRAVQKKLLKN